MQPGSSLACPYPDMAVGLTGGGPRHAYSRSSDIVALYFVYISHELHKASRERHEC